MGLSIMNTIKKNISILFLGLMILVSVNSFAQHKTLSLTEFIGLVKQNHPVAKQAALQVDKAKADLLSSRGAFDPVFQLETENKTFDNKNYYFYTNPELKFATWPGIDVKAGLENNGGKFIDPEYSIGKTSYLGIEVPLARNLLMDKRRAALMTAKIMVNMGEQERLQMMNDLLFDAYLSYWNWAGAEQIYAVVSRFVTVSNQRLGLVRLAWQQGDRPAIDTTEALAQLQSFLAMQADAQVDVANARLQVSNYLWNENDTAYMLPDDWAPDSLTVFGADDELALSTLLETSNLSNPSLQMYNYKLDALDVEKRLKFQSLLPYFNVKANMLNSGYSVLKNVNIPFVENNYKFGVDVKIPLLLRDGRGDYKKAKLKIAETKYMFSNKQWEVENKIKSYFNETVALEQQIKLNQSAYTGYETLLRAENTRYQNGESSLFLINTRENKVLETAQKIIELEVKWMKARYAAQWSAGVLR